MQTEWHRLCARCKAFFDKRKGTLRGAFLCYEYGGRKNGKAKRPCRLKYLFQFTGRGGRRLSRTLPKQNTVMPLLTGTVVSASARARFRENR